MAYTDIDKPSDYFNTKLYTGNGSSGHAITGVGFQPDWVYTTSRSNAYNNGMFDSVRGVNKELTTNTTNAEASLSTAISSFDSNGFTFSGSGYNTNNYTFVSWNWLAGTSVSGNTGGSGTAKSYSGSVNTDAGFSIISYTGNFTNGQTTPHHLGAVPKMIIVKNYANASESWNVYHESIGNTKYLALNTTAAADTAPRWNNTSPTSTVFSNGANGASNANNETIIAYCFAEKKGYSKFGSYTGNGNADGTFVYTGFKPAMVIVKLSSGSNNWNIHDNKRDTFNVVDRKLEPNVTDADSEDSPKDFLSNGFKCRGTGGNLNASGSTYIYMAFAENPFVTSTGIPATAR